MNQETKSLLKRSINHFLSATDQEKENCINQVKNNLKVHKKGLNTIGFGYAENNVTAGSIFLKIFNK